MSRNGSGVYTLPANSWNPAVDDTTIDASDWNDTGSDLETAITDSISSDGQTTTTAAIPFAAGVKISNTGLQVYGGDNVHLLTFKPGSSITSSRTLTIITGDQDVTVTLPASGTLATPAAFPNYISGLTLSTAGSSATFGVAVGVACNTTNVSAMRLASAYTKTTSTWALGTAAGSLDTGTIANSTWYYPYLIQRTDTGVVDVLTSLAPGASATITMTVASPGIITWTGHGLQANAQVVFTTTGALPTGLTAGTTYYVKTVVSADTFSVAATQGGTAINTTGSQSGVHTATSNPTLPTNYTLFRRIGALLTNSSAQWVLFTQTGNLFSWAVPYGDISTTTLDNTASSVTLTVPKGIGVFANIRGYMNNAAETATLITPLTETDVTPNASNGNLTTINIGGNAASYNLMVATNTSAQVRTRANRSSTSLYGFTHSWTDLRGSQ
jgi:hypothetical protein